MYQSNFAYLYTDQACLFTYMPTGKVGICARGGGGLFTTLQSKRRFVWRAAVKSNLVSSNFENLKQDLKKERRISKTVGKLNTELFRMTAIFITSGSAELSPDGKIGQNFPEVKMELFP